MPVFARRELEQFFEHTPADRDSRSRLVLTSIVNFGTSATLNLACSFGFWQISLMASKTWVSVVILLLIFSHTPGPAATNIINEPHLTQSTIAILPFRDLSKETNTAHWETSIPKMLELQL